MRQHTILKPLALVSLAAMCLGITSIDPAHRFSWGENIGFLNWSDANGGLDGVELHPTFLSGYIWAENVGYINVGDGTPGGGTVYANADGGDAGVNLDGSNNLYGLAWGENIGWINFDTRAQLSGFGQQARYDAAAHRFRGYAWGENVGWINLDDATHYVGVVPPAGLTLVSGLSRRVHGAAGTFDLNLPLAGSSVEDREGGPTTLVLTFSDPIRAVDGTADCGEITLSSGTCAGASIAGSELTITLSGAANAGCLRVAVSGIESTGGAPLSGDNDVHIRALRGDRTGDGVVNIVDLNEVKGDLFQALTAVNFVSDITVDGVVNIVDLNATKGALFTTATCP